MVSALLQCDMKHPVRARRAALIKVQKPIQESTAIQMLLINAVTCEGPCCGLRDEQQVRDVSGTVNFSRLHLLLDQPWTRHTLHPALARNATI